MNITPITPEHNVNISTISALEAATNGRVFPSWELSTVIGVEKEVLHRLINRIGNFEVLIPDDIAVICNVLTNLLGYPHNAGEILSNDYQLSTEKLKEASQYWSSV